MDGLTTSIAFLAGLGLPQVLLWVLSFAIVFAVLTKLGIFKRAPAALISIVAGFFVLLAVPLTLITVIASMSTGLVALAIGVLVIIVLLEVAQAKHFDIDPKTNMPDLKTAKPWLMGHSTIVAAALVITSAVIFWASGGAALIGIPALPAIGMETWLLIIVGIAVLWMIQES
jgi:hypothetical protein